MKFTIERNIFLNALANASRLITGKEVNAILTNIKLEVTNEKLFIISSNGECSTKVVIDRFKNDKEFFRDIIPGSILINAKVITEIVKKLDSKEIYFSVEDDTIAKIINDKSVYNINVIRATEYPDISFDENGIRVIIKKNQFIESCNQVSFAAMIKDSKPLLKTVHIEGKDDKLVITATDGARLARKEINYEGIENFQCNIPSKLLNEALRSASDEELIEFFVSSNNCLFKFKDSYVLTSVMKGDYPDTKKIIPTNFFYSLEVNGVEFIKACERAAIFSAEKENIVKLTLTQDECIISSKSQQSGDASESLSLFTFEGERLEISFNVEFVSQAINALKSDEIIIKFLGEMKPFMIVSKNDNTIIQLITPVRTY